MNRGTGYSGRVIGFLLTRHVRENPLEHTFLGG